MSETPRTDADHKSRDFGGLVCYNFACQLERELGRVIEQRQKIRDEILKLERELGEAREAMLLGQNGLLQWKQCAEKMFSDYSHHGFISVKSASDFKKLSKGTQ